MLAPCDDHVLGRQRKVVQWPVAGVAHQIADIHEVPVFCKRLLGHLPFGRLKLLLTSLPSAVFSASVCSSVVFWFSPASIFSASISASIFCSAAAVCFSTASILSSTVCRSDAKMLKTLAPGTHSRQAGPHSVHHVHVASPQANQRMHGKLRVVLFTVRPCLLHGVQRVAEALGCHMCSRI